MKKLGFGLIGVGKWGKHYLRIIQNSKHNLIGVAVKTEKTKDSLQKKNKNLFVTTDYKDLLRNPKINCIIVCTPIKTHFKIVKDCLVANKNVLCEKPLTDSLNKTIKLSDLSKKQEKVLMVGYQYLYNSYVKKMRGIIKSNGDNSCYFSWHLSSKEFNKIDSETIKDAGCHFVSLLLFLFNFKRYKIISKSYSEDEKLFTITVLLDGKKWCLLTINNFSDIKINSMTFMGKKHLMLNHCGLEAKFFVNKKRKVMSYHEPLVKQFNDFVSCVVLKKLVCNDVFNSVRIAIFFEGLK